MNEVSQAMDSVIIAGIVSMVMEWLKKAPWFPLIKDAQGRLNVVISATVAAAAAIGIHVSFDSATGVLMVTGLTASTVLHGGWEWGKQFFLQEAMYRTLVKEKKIDANVTVSSLPPTL